MKINFKSTFHKYFKWLRKWIINSKGLTLALLVGISTNIFSDQINHQITKQRYLELLSYEIRTNMLTAGSVLDEFNNNNGTIYLERFLKNDAYISGLNSGFLLDVPPEELAEIYAVYSVIPSYNKMLEFQHNLMNEATAEIAKCITDWNADSVTDPTEAYNKTRCDKEFEVHKQALKNSSGTIVQTWSSYLENSDDITWGFNPVKKRLNSPLLKFFMGTESLEVLK